MRTQHAQYLSQLLSSVWNIDKLRGRTLLTSIVNALVKNERPSEDIFGDPLPKMQIVGDVALIPLYGVLSIDVPDWLKSYGINLTDANDIEEEIEDALEDENAQMIFVDVSGPGGLSLAGNKLFDLFEAANKKKPVGWYCGDGRSAASASYQAVAGATAGYCGPYADGIGCVGTYLAYLDDTEWWTQMGMKWELFKSGEIKGIGESVPLTQAQKDFLQGTVDQFGARFRGNVLKHRTAIDPADLQGQWFDGATAAKKNFVSGLAPDLQTAISKFRRAIAA